MQDIARRIQRTESLEALVDGILAGLEESFGFKHSMILVPGEEAGALVTIATRGYAEIGAGAALRIGKGIAGVVAEARKPIRISGLLRGMLYALASGKTTSRAGCCCCGAGSSRIAPTFDSSLDRAAVLR